MHARWMDYSYHIIPTTAPKFRLALAHKLEPELLVKLHQVLEYS
jgi:hypothetical protein